MEIVSEMTKIGFDRMDIYPDKMEIDSDMMSNDPDTLEVNPDPEWKSLVFRQEKPAGIEAKRINCAETLSILYYLHTDQSADAYNMTNGIRFDNIRALNKNNINS